MESTNQIKAAFKATINVQLDGPVFPAHPYLDKSYANMESGM